MDEPKESKGIVKVTQEEKPFTKQTPSSRPQLGRRSSRHVLPPPSLRPPDPGLISLKGLLVAHRLSKGLKARTAQKLAAKKGIKAAEKKSIPIIIEQVPIGCAQPAELFPTGLVTRLIQSFLASHLKGAPYGSGSPLQSQELSVKLRAMVRSVCPPRYRLVCVVSQGPVGQAGLIQASRCLWDAHTDTCVTHTTHTTHVFCTVVVFAVYYE